MKTMINCCRSHDDEFATADKLLWKVPKGRNYGNYENFFPPFNILSSRHGKNMKIDDFTTNPQMFPSFKHHHQQQCEFGDAKKKSRVENQKKRAI
jgi:hypothetical protein